MIIPANLSNAGFLYDIAHNKITVHFIHRTLAYFIALFIIIWWLYARKSFASAIFNKAKNLTLLLVIVQVCLGIFTVLSSPKIVAGKFGTFEWLAEMHQLTGMLLLLSLVTVVYLSGRSKQQVN
jgi:cytochrome c oxidase assembly protein subunit 15